MCLNLNLFLERTAEAEPLLSFNILTSTLFYPMGMGMGMGMAKAMAMAFRDGAKASIRKLNNHKNE